MRIAFLASDKPREQLLADAFLQGVRRHGHTTETIPLGTENRIGTYDVAVMVGVKSRELFNTHRTAGVPVIYMDKGYSRHKAENGRKGWEFWRVSVDHHHPTDRLATITMPSDRWDRLGFRIKPWRPVSKAGPIILAGSSAKYHEFYGLKEPTTFAKDLVRDIRAVSNRPIVYRPKPSWREAVPLKKTAFSRLPETLDDLLKTAHVLVTHGSNACFEAMLAGVPSVVTGAGVTRDLGSIDIAEVEAPQMCSDPARLRLFHNLAWFQWTASEMASGAAWDFIGTEIHQ